MSKNLINDMPVKDAVGPVTRRDGAFVEEKNRNNGTKLLSGNHGKVSLAKPATTVTSTPDATVIKRTTSESSNIIYGMTYECDGDEPAVRVEAGGSTILIGCHFTKDANTQSASSAYITVANGGHVACVGCYFYNTQAAGSVIATAGPANSSSAVGCFNATGRAHGASVQVVGEVTV